MDPGDAAVPAVILAGGRNSEAFARAGEDPRRGLAEIHGRPMVAYVVDALGAASRVRSVTVVAGDEFPQLPGVAVRLQARGTMTQNIAAALAACMAERGLLLASADAPFMTPAAIDHFVDRAVASGASLCYPVVARAANEARFPEMRRTYACLREGEFTGGNAFFLRPVIWPGVERVLEIVHGVRKQPWRLATLLGPRIIWRYLRHSLTIPEAEAHVGRLLGGSCRAIVTPYAELGADVDDPADLAVARRVLRPGD